MSLSVRSSTLERLQYHFWGEYRCVVYAIFVKDDCRVRNPSSVHYYLIDAVRECAARVRVARRDPLEAARMVCLLVREGELELKMCRIIFRVILFIAVVWKLHSADVLQLLD